MRMAPKWASGRLAVDRFIQKLEESVSLMSEGGVALMSSVHRRRRYAYQCGSPTARP